LALTAALLALLARQVSATELRATVAALRPERLLAAGAFYSLVHVARAARFRALLGPRPPSVAALVPLSAAVSLLNHVLVSRAGDAAFVALARRYDRIGTAEALAAIGVARLLDLLAVALLFLLSTGWSLRVLPGRADALLAAAALALLAGGALFLLGPTARWLRSWLTPPRTVSSDAAGTDSSEPTLRAQLRDLTLGTAQAVQQLRGAGAYRPALLASLLAWGLTFVWLWLLVGAMGREVALAPFVVGATFGTIAKALPLPTLGGHGLAEAGWTIGFTAVLGWPLGEAISVGLSVSLLSVLFAALYGLPGLAWLTLRPDRPVRTFAALLCLTSFLTACGPGATTTPPPPTDGRAAVLHHLERHAVGGDALALAPDVADAVPAIAARELGLRRLVLPAPGAARDRAGEEQATIDPRLRTLLAEGRPPAWVWLADTDAEPGEGNAVIGRWLDARATGVADERFGSGTGVVRLRAWQRPPDVDAGEYPPTVAPTELGALELLGWSVSPEPLVAGRAARVSIAWLVNQAEPAPPLLFSLGLLDGRDRDQAQPGVSAAPFGGLKPPPLWPPMDITVAPHALALPEDLPPGRYRLTLRLRAEGETDALWPAEQPLELGAVRVVAPARNAGGAR
jgi:uncharacterized membrane protein YbhN (UPF0104 family)